MAPGWAAVAGADYEWVMPLTTRKKWGIAYLYQPAFTQQLGVFAKAGVLVPYQAILECLQQHYKFCEINWNYELQPSNYEMAITITAATNFILDLSVGYASLSALYHDGLVESLKRSVSFKLRYKTSVNYRRCIDLYRKYYGRRMPHVNNTDYKNFVQVCTHADRNSLLICREAVDPAGETLASALLLFDGRRMYNVINMTTAAGRKKMANHFLIDCLILEFASEQLIFDFEGSDLPGVKGFYNSFGPNNEPYFKVKYNLLSWPLNIFKR